MLDPVRRSAAWLGGRLLLLALIVVALAAWQAYRVELSLLGRGAGAVLPDSELQARLARARGALAGRAQAELAQANARLAADVSATPAALDARLAALDRAIAATLAARRSQRARTLALLTGDGVEDDLGREVRLQLLQAERASLLEFRAAAAAAGGSCADARDGARAARRAADEAYARYRRAYDAVLDWRRANPVLDFDLNPVLAGLRAARDSAEAEYRPLNAAWDAARLRRDVLCGAAALRAAPIAIPAATLLAPLDEAIAARRDAELAARRFADVARDVFWQALGIVVAVTLAPVALKAFWYFAVAPFAARRPPLRLRAQAPAGPTPRAVRSAVSLEIVLRDGEELVVHPEYLQSSADRGRKDTRWLLQPRLPLTSLAAGMVALTRVRDAAGSAYVVSSRTDPLAEVAAIELQPDDAFVLQPRHLVGLVQREDRPVRIERRWNFGLAAWITLQFRWLVFEGPGTLLVRGCRGVRVEPVGAGRSVDQRATIGFDAHVACSARRSETFGAYLLGMRGLFNDGFAGTPGRCAYEEMPYAGRRAGLTGRGLEGLTDGVLRALGI